MLCSAVFLAHPCRPTSGLDSRAAQLVMRVVRRIADTGRTVITTIHQPSAELFFMMDSLLLLQKGGWTAYYGPIGHHGRTMVQYLQRLPGVTPCPRRMNPASWMLDALSGSDSSGGHLPATAGAVADGGGHGHGTASTAEAHTWSVTHDSRHEPVAMSPLPDTPSVDATPASAADLVKPAAPSALSDVSGSSTAAQGIPGPLLQATLLASPEWASCLAKVEAYSTPAPGSMPYAFTSQYATSWPHQLGCLLQRTWRSYMRNVPYNYTRWTALLGLVLLFGTIWYQLEADDIGGVQSLVSVIFMTSLCECTTRRREDFSLAHTEYCGIIYLLPMIKCKFCFNLACSPMFNPRPLSSSPFPCMCSRGHAKYEYLSPCNDQRTRGFLQRAFQSNVRPRGVW